MHPLRVHLEKIISLSDEEFSTIVSHTDKRTLKRNQLLLSEGEVCSADFFVLSGSLRQFYSDSQGKEHVAQFAFADWWISDWYSILSREPSCYKIEALEESEVLKLDSDALQMLFSQIPQLEKYFRVIFQRAFAAQQRRILWLQKSAKERYLEFLQVYGYFEQKLSQAQIASYLGISRESLSRLKTQLNQHLK